MAALIHTPSRKRGYGLYDDNIGLASDCKRIRNSTELSAATPRVETHYFALKIMLLLSLTHHTQYSLDEGRRTARRTSVSR